MKKVNIGIVFIILSIVAFISVTVMDIKSKYKEIENVKEFLNNYFQVCNKYAMLEKENRDINQKMDRDEYSTYLSKMELELDKYILDSRRDYIFDMYKERLDDQYKGSIMYNEYKIDNEVLEEFDINEDIIYVKLLYNLKVNADKREYPVFDKELDRYIGLVKQVTGVMQESDIIVIKKFENNQYKIVYHDIKSYTEFPFEKFNVFFNM